MTGRVTAVRRAKPEKPKLPNIIKTLGYVVSTLSVMLLGLVSWKTASSDPLLFACLIGGMLASVAGMVLRWTSYQLDD